MGVIENDNDISGEKSESSSEHYQNNNETTTNTNPAVSTTTTSTATEDHRRLENGGDSSSIQAAPLLLSSDITSNINHNTSVASDTCDMASLEILKHRDLYPKKSAVCDDDKCSSIVDQLPMLSGEYVQFVGPSGKLNDETLLLTNYRLFLLMHDSTAFVNIPIMLVESIECRDIVHIYIYLKVAKTVRITFSSNEKALIWYTRINAAITRLYKLNELFSFAFHSWNEKPDECSFVNSSPTDLANLVLREFKRMKFDSKLWRLSDVNRKFELCSTYPETVIVPRCITDDQLRKVACFRSSKRFPAVVWRSRKTGAVLARSSQPNVGLLAWRLNEDELLLKAIADSCHLSATNSSKHHHNHHNHNGSHNSNSNQNSHSSAGASSAITNTVTANSINHSSTLTTASSSATPISQQQQVTTSNANVSSNTQGTNGPVNGIDSAANKLSPIGTPLLLILDARFRSVALANRVKGGGYEYTEYYTNCEIQFMNLENIHVIRSSFQSLRALCQSVVDNKQFLSQLEATKWLQHVSGIMKAAYTTCATVDQLGKPVLVHCSDGWDRTPQILALAKLCLDPYYRTLTGLRTLIEIEWLAFGHKFAQRNGHANNYNDVNERCPVFLQWLDCVYQLTRQFPSAFQFNEVCLLKLCYHAYSCLFGTFLCDSALERQQNRVDLETFSVWSYLNEQNREIVNHLYDDTYDEVLYPNYELVNLQLWQRLFCEPEITYLVKVDHSKQYDMHAFNDSIDGCLYGSSPVAADNILSGGAGGSGDLNSSSSCNQINSLLKNAIDTNASAIFTSSVSNQKANSSSNLNKSRSFDDLTSKLREGGAEDSSTTGTSPSSPPQPGSLSGDPVVAMVKCNSESNLLLDALKSASPKSHNNATSFSFKSSNGNNTESANGQQLLTQENEESEKRPALLMVATGSSSNNGSSSETNTPATTTPNENRSTSQSQMSSSESSSQSPSPPVEHAVMPASSHPANAASYKQLLLMQNSTETLVDEAQVILNKLALSSTTNDELRPSPVPPTNGHIIDPTTTTTTSSSEQSSQPTSSSNSSTLPSPCGTTNCNPSAMSRTTNTVSTSTNGLDEYIETNCELAENSSTNNKTGNNNNGNIINKLTPNMLMMMRSQQQHLNDTIRYFERNFVNTFDDFYIEENVNGGDFFLNDFYNQQQQQQGAPQQGNTNNKAMTNGRRSDDSDRKLYDVNSGSYGSKRYVSSTSKSIPIVNKNGDKSVSVKKSNVKTIKDCIDIDGLTRVDDRSYRKIIERDEKYKREILFLRDQVNKCKWFFNKLATSNHQDVVPNGDFLFNTDYLPESCQSEENQSNCYSFSNDSMCSSWDEIDEADYKLASWVPDYYVTHCQGCNNKFSYRLRKHHCRNCGQVFCYKCADQFYPLPKYNLTAPVRVCHACEILLEKQQQQQPQQQLPIKSRNGSGSSFGNPTRSQHMYSSPSSNVMYSSTPPFAADMLSNSPTSNLSASNNNSNSKLKLHNPIYGRDQAGSPSSSSSRCNQNLDLSKFRKSGSDQQKVSV